MKNRPVYKETQSFVTWWVCLLFLLLVGVGVYMAWNNSNNPKVMDFYTGALIGVGVFAIIGFTRLHSRIDTEGIHVRFFPFIWKEKTWRWDEIDEVYVKKYSVWEYGGWGYRLSGAGTAYTTLGTYGVQIVIERSGKRILIGTQKPHEVEGIIEQYR